MIYWFTGQPGAGKTTLALELIKHLDNPIHIDGDNLRDILKNYDYTDVGRKKNIENVITIARFLDFKKFDVVISESLIVFIILCKVVEPDLPVAHIIINFIYYIYTLIYHFLLQFHKNSFVHWILKDIHPLQNHNVHRTFLHFLLYQTQLYHQ